MNTFGLYLRLTTFGESHGPATGGVLDGLPAGLKIDFDAVGREVDSRRPGGSYLATQRNETDSVEWLSGFSPEGVTLGSPIAFMTRNRDCRPGDYENLRHTYRPNHADYVTEAKYGLRDHRGGGRASARETFARVVAGALASQWLAKFGIGVQAALCSVGHAEAANVFADLLDNTSLPPALNVSDEETEQMYLAILHARGRGDSLGGSVAGLITGLPAGVGEPVYAKLHARLAEAMMGINAAKGFEYGLGMETARAWGSEVLDTPLPGEKFTTATNRSGGINGGISNGMPVFFRVAFKPTPTLRLPVETIDDTGRSVTLSAAGRHDPCVALRAVTVVRAMAALTVADLLLAPFSPLHNPAH